MQARSKIRTILLSGFTAGALDIVAAIVVYSFIMKVVTPAQLLQGIASGVLGKAAFEGGPATVVLGLLFHFIIAYSFAIAYFFIFPYISLLRRQTVISGFFYGVFVWLVMNLIIVPLSNANQSPFTLLSVVRGMAILILCVGLPVSFITARYYSYRNRA